MCTDKLKLCACVFQYFDFPVGGTMTKTQIHCSRTAQMKLKLYSYVGHAEQAVTSHLPVGQEDTLAPGMRDGQVWVCMMYDERTCGLYCVCMRVIGVCTHGSASFVICA